MGEIPEPPPDPQPKKRSINDLLPEKAGVPTSLGTLYVRHIYGSDWKHFEGDDSNALGRAAVQRLTTRAQDKRDSSPLTDDDVNALLDEDYAALAPAISKRSGWGGLPAGRVELGEAVKRGREQEAQRHQKMLDDMRKSIDSSYAFLGENTLQKLQEQMAGLSSIRQSISAMDSLKAAMGSTGLLDRSIHDVLVGVQSAPDKLSDLGCGTDIFGPAAPRAVEMLSFPIPPRPEDSALGRATLESAENSREAVQRMDALVAVIGGLNQTLVQDVLPAWFKKVEGDQHQAEKAFSQAGRSLWWTKWAVIASVVVALFGTGLQIYVALKLDHENSKTLRVTESLLRDQLSVQQKLAEQHAFEATHLRRLVEQQAKDADKLRNLLDSKLLSSSRK